MGITWLSLGLGAKVWSADKKDMILRSIPKSGEQIPVVGMGSWLTFDVLGSKVRMENMKQVLKAFYDTGGRVLDSSPMYGSSEEVIGRLAQELNISDKLWQSTKVWTDGRESGQRQIMESRQYLGHVDLHHVHNIRDFKIHYDTLKKAKEKGEIKYVGVTHYVNSAHDDLEQLIRNYDLDFIQVNYSIDNPTAGDRLLPTALDHEVGVIINKPYQTGALFDSIKGEQVPQWAIELGIRNWPEFFLKYIISNEAVTCVIPATTQVAHARENNAAGSGYIPDDRVREQMEKYYRSII